MYYELDKFKNEFLAMTKMLLLRVIGNHISRMLICFIFFILAFFTLYESESWTNACASTRGDSTNLREIANSKELFKIDEIDVRGPRKIEKEAILDKIRSRKGMILDSDTLRDDIQTIYRMKYFESVEAHHEIRNGKNYLVWVLKERPIIKSITYVGADDLGKDDFKDKVKSKEFSILDVNTVKADVAEIKKIYEEKGYYLASVDYELKRINDENVDLIFKIKEYDKIRVKKITILGNRAFKDTEIKEIMKTREESLLSGLSDSGNFRDFDFETDIERVKYFYKTKGYLQINVSRPIVTVSEDKRWLFISFRVTEGPKFDVNKIFFEGELLFSDQEMRDKMVLKEGETYSEDTMQKDLRMLTELYQDEGYAFANVIRTLQIVPGENKVDIHFSFEKGKIVHFGKITVHGNTQTRDKVIRRELLIREGAKFSGSSLRKSKENINRLGFFDPEQIIFNQVAVKGHDDVLDIDISVKEKSTGEFRFGAGYSTASAGFIQTSIMKHNFRGLGQDLSATVNWAKNEREYDLGFTEPYLFDTLWTAGGDLYLSKNELYKEQEGYVDNKKGFDARLGYPIMEYARLFLIYKLDYKKIDLVYNDGLAVNPLIDTSIENGPASSLSLRLEYDRRDNRWDPTGGFYGSLGFGYTGVGGSKIWSRSDLDLRYFKAVVSDLVFRSRIQSSQIYERSGHPVPYSEKFTLGGPKTLRGFDYGAVGPSTTLVAKDYRGQIIYSDKEKTKPLLSTYNLGGLFSIVGSIELEYPLVKEAGVKLATFVDTGNIFNHWIGENGNYRMRTDWGFGIRWFSPVGPLRFEWGFPLDRKPGEAPNSFQFDIGQVF